MYNMNIAVMEPVVLIWHLIWIRSLNQTVLCTEEIQLTPDI